MRDILGLNRSTFSLQTNSHYVDRTADVNLKQNPSFYGELASKLDALREAELNINSIDERFYDDFMTIEHERRPKIGEAEDRKAHTLYIRGSSPIFLNAGMTKLFVYCDIIRPQILPDEVAPCLRQVAYAGEYRKVTTVTFTDIHYRDLNVLEMDTIHIWIHSESGEMIPFEFPSFSVTLKFRPKSV